MRRLTLIVRAVNSALIAAHGAWADCIRVIGTASAGQAASMDPAFSNINDDGYQQTLFHAPRHPYARTLLSTVQILPGEAP